ncbi:hypothetical protein CHS0354_037102 [Potamilus streckersoni]|uniref:Uncharacterized protein n=1 Tax=Potamilus streckersoni TaxID=2493646 RepID=A0AAE0RP49_9BIVA|nr:hypothetical protein CHS0354_037102 [Potamilus streckersoni]
MTPSTNTSNPGLTQSGTCGERLLHCLSNVPCASLIAWITLLLGLGGLTGSILTGVPRTRDLLRDDATLWFMEHTIIGVLCGMFVFGTLLLLVGHLSSDPTSRHTFNTSKKNACARGLNIMLLILTFILGISWIIISAVIAIPLMMLLLLLYLHDYMKENCFNLANYGFSFREMCGHDFAAFTDKGRELLICYIIAYAAVVLIAASLIHFLINISANITHLRDTRFVTLHAYEEENEEVRNSASKHSNLADTTM